MKKIRLFLIDIDPHYLELAFRYLSSTQDVEVVGYASDAARALALIGQAQPDCIVLSLAQRRCYGLALLRMLRAIPSQPALIVCTSFLSETALRLSRDVGADMFLSKPVPLEHLHECVVGTTRVKRRMLEEQRNAEETDARAQAESQVEPETEEAEMEIAEEFPDAPEPAGDEEIEVEVEEDGAEPKEGDAL